MDPLAQLGRLQRLHGVRTLPVQSLHRMSGAQVSELLQFALSLHFAGGGIACASTKDVIRLLGTLELGHLVGDKAHLEPAKNYRNLERAMRCAMPLPARRGQIASRAAGQSLVAEAGGHPW